MGPRKQFVCQPSSGYDNASGNILLASCPSETKVVSDAFDAEVGHRSIVPESAMASCKSPW